MLAEAQRALEQAEAERARKAKIVGQKRNKEIVRLERSIDLNQAKISAITEELGRLLIWQALEKEQDELSRLRFETDEFIRLDRRRRNNVMLALLLDS